MKSQIISAYSNWPWKENLQLTSEQDSLSPYKESTWKVKDASDSKSPKYPRKDNIKGHRHEPIFNLTIQTAINHAFPNNKNQLERIFNLLNKMQQETFSFIIKAKPKDFRHELREAHYRIKPQIRDTCYSSLSNTLQKPSKEKSIMHSSKPHQKSGSYPSTPK